MLIKNANLILLDLDGTIIDSQEGIINGLSYTIKKMGLPSRASKELYPFIGPPLRDTFSKDFELSPQEVDQAIKYYRKYYIAKGLYECKPYPGIDQALQALHLSGKYLTVATSKPWIFAHRVLACFKLRCYFDTVFGCYRDGRLDSKEQVIAAVLGHYSGINQLSPGRLLYKANKQPLENCHPIMVGDRYYDVLGAKKNNVDTIGVAYGYGSHKELTDSGAIAVVDKPTDLIKILK